MAVTLSPEARRSKLIANLVHVARRHSTLSGMTRRMYKLKRTYEPEDLVNEIFLKAMERIDSYSGTGRFDVWVLSLGRNLLCDMLKQEKIFRRRHQVGTEDLECVAQAKGGLLDDIMGLRCEAQHLMDWLQSDEGIREIPWGWQAFRLLLRSHGNFTYVASALTVVSKSIWTTKRVRKLVDKFKETPYGHALQISLAR